MTVIAKDIYIGISLDNRINPNIPAWKKSQLIFKDHKNIWQ